MYIYIGVFLFMRGFEMKNVLKVFGIIVLVVVIGFSMTACGDDGNNDNNGNNDIEVTFNNITANGSSTQTTTQLTLTFSKAITGLSAADITLTGVSNISKGTLTNSEAVYTLPISGFPVGGS